MLLRRGEFVSGGRLSDKRVCEVLNELGTSEHVEGRGGGKSSYMTLPQALSLRKQLLVSKLASSNWRLRENLPSICKQYARGRDVVDMCDKHDLPPMAILRAIFTERALQRWPDLEHSDVKDGVKLALRQQREDNLGGGRGEVGEEMETRRSARDTAARMVAANLLDQRDLEQLVAAKAVDQVAYTEDNIEEREASKGWEQRLFDHFDAHGVKYASEEQLVAEGFRSTPDAVLIDDVWVNGRLIRWVDCKSYYGSYRSKLFGAKTKKQVERYNLEFGGEGALVFRLGYSRELQKNLGQCLLLDRGLLPDDDLGTE